MHAGLLPNSCQAILTRDLWQFEPFPLRSATGHDISEWRRGCIGISRDWGRGLYEEPSLAVLRVIEVLVSSTVALVQSLIYGRYVKPWLMPAD